MRLLLRFIRTDTLGSTKANVQRRPSERPVLPFPLSPRVERRRYTMEGACFYRNLIGGRSVIFPGCATLS